ncbi:MAG TPA: hypothetical protein VL634_21695, partial [Mycobacterium sp.]|nr:hypothetical protein [Mycobacterium sp.]
MGSRVLGAASACLVASGLFLCGLGGALALAQPSAPPVVPGDTQPDDVNHGKGPKGDADGTGGSKASTGKNTDTKDTPTEKPGDGGNPDNGNCGNDKDNGNAQGCGGGSTDPSPSSPAPSTIRTSETKTSETTKPSPSTKPSETSTSESSETTPTTTTSVGVPAPVGGGGGGGAPEAPAGGGALPPKMQLPPELLPPATEPSVIDVVPGVGAAAVDLPIPPLTLPVIVAPAAGLGGGGAPAAPVLKGMPRGVSAEPPAGREPLPAAAGSNIGVPPASYRIGYTDYLRNAGLSQVAALAVPGVAGMLVLTG